LQHKCLLGLSDDVIKLWAQASPNHLVRSRLAAMSGLLRSAAESGSTSPLVVANDLLGAFPAGQASSDYTGAGQLGFDASFLDDMWFEQV
jgi:hypothetical protein